MNISFDFDSTLENPELQLVAVEFIENGHNVFIITSRLDSGLNNDLLHVALRLNIQQDRIIFTNGQSKVKFINDNEINIHFEDCPFECNEISGWCAVVQVVPLIK